MTTSLSCFFSSTDLNDWLFSSPKKWGRQNRKAALAPKKRPSSSREKKRSSAGPSIGEGGKMFNTENIWTQKKCERRKNRQRPSLSLVFVTFRTSPRPVLLWRRMAMKRAPPMHKRGGITHRRRMAAIGGSRPVFQKKVGRSITRIRWRGVENISAKCRVLKITALLIGFLVNLSTHRGVHF